MSQPPKLAKADLRPFCGSETYYRHWANRRVVYTEGVQYLARKGEAYWLIDAICLTQAEPSLRRLPEDLMQRWTLKVADDRSAVLTCMAGEKAIYSQTIPWTDFPLDDIELWFCNRTLYLPSEH